MNFRPMVLVLAIVFAVPVSLALAEEVPSSQLKPVFEGVINFLDLDERSLVISDKHFVFAGGVVRLNGSLVSGDTAIGQLNQNMKVRLEVQEGTQSVIDVLETVY